MLLQSSEVLNAHHLLPTKKNPNRCFSHAGGLTGLLLNYEPAEFVVLFRVLQPHIPVLLRQG